jgi:N6-L-threonylcarbamoyladenine synthase
VKSIYGLGIETSCDETALAVIKDGIHVLSKPLFSQISLHQDYGGIVPELASRAHLEKIPILLDELIMDLKKINLSISDLSYVAVTMRPGLQGSLLIGYQAALAITSQTEATLIPIHHLEAHFYAARLNNWNPSYPFLGILLSGGNSSIFIVEGLGKIQKIADTLDDAAGEALDKAAALLDLPYPGGPSLDQLASAFEDLPDEENPLPVILSDQPKTVFDFSFSGLKTALLYTIREKPDFSKAKLAFYFRERVIQLILRNLKRAILKTGLKIVIAAGGVLANPRLGKMLKGLAKEMNIQIIIPAPELCTDNAVMVSSLGHSYFTEKKIPESYFVTSSNDFTWKSTRN